MEVMAPSLASTQLSNSITTDIRKKDGTTDTKENLWYVTICVIKDYSNRERDREKEEKEI